MRENPPRASRAQKGGATTALNNAGIKPSDIVSLIQKYEAKLVDFRFTDAAGCARNVTIPTANVDDQTLLAGIAAGNLLVKPDLATARIDTMAPSPTVSLTCELFDPVAKSASPLDPRAIAKRAQEYARFTGIADSAHFAPEIEFYMLAHDRGSDRGTFAAPMIAEDGNPPHAGLRSLIAIELAKSGIGIETIRSGASSEGQTKVSVKSEALLQSADAIVTLKHIVKAIAARGGVIATFMPKPLSDASGSGMTCRQSLWKDSRPLFFDANGYAECSQTMLYYIGGLLTHVRSLAAFGLPATNSYARLAASPDAPVNVAFSARNGSATVGIPMLFPGNAKAKRLDFRAADPSANPYLAFSAMLLAGLDGIKRKIDPVRAGFGPLDGDATKTKTLPGSLRESLDALARDHDYLTENGVFGVAFVEHWIATKTATEANPVQSRPHPYEFELYLDC